MRGHYGDTPAGLQLDVAVDPVSIAWGDTLRIQLTITNFDADPATRQYSSGCTSGFTIRTVAQEVVAPQGFACSANVPTEIYYPQDPVIRKFRWVWDDPRIGTGRYLLYAGLGRRGEVQTAEPVEIELRD